LARRWSRWIGLESCWTGSSAFSLLTALAASVFPIGPVPITGQTFAVLLTGARLLGFHAWAQWR